MSAPARPKRKDPEWGAKSPAHLSSEGVGVRDVEGGEKRRERETERGRERRSGKGWEGGTQGTTIA